MNITLKWIVKGTIKEIICNFFTDGGVQENLKSPLTC